MIEAITSQDLISWLRWADAGVTEAEKKARTDRVWKYVYPDDLDMAERSMRDVVVDYVKHLGEPESWDGWPEPKPLPGEGQPVVVEEKPKREPLPPLQWKGLIPSSSRAYRRGSLHDGTADEVESMRARSRGSPFEADPGDDEPAPTKRPRRRTGIL